MAVKIAVTREYEDEKRHVHSNRLLLFLLQKKLIALSDIFFNFWRLCTYSGFISSTIYTISIQNSRRIPFGCKKNVCFCTICDFGSPTIVVYIFSGKLRAVHNSVTYILTKL